jgi:hypothetical protein
MDHPVFDPPELPGMKLDLIPVGHLEGFKQGRWKLVFRLLLFLFEKDRGVCGDLLSDCHCRKCMLAISFLNV